MWVLLAAALTCGAFLRLDRRITAAVFFMALLLACMPTLLSRPVPTHPRWFYWAGLVLSMFALLCLATLLGGNIYGLAWLCSGKLWIATLFHFLLNLIHLLFFTYPFYRPGG